MNNVILIGNLTDNAKTKELEKSTVITFTLAVKRKFDKEKSSFINISTFRKEDKLSQYLTKGTKVAVNGELQVDNVKDDNGNWKTYVKVVAENLELLGKKENTHSDNNAFEDTPFGEPIDDGDMPFN